LTIFTILIVTHLLLLFRTAATHSCCYIGRFCGSSPQDSCMSCLRIHRRSADQFMNFVPWLLLLL
jgi:hypothetical protein